MTPSRRGVLLLASLAALTLLRLVVAGSAPLAPDEAYYWIFSRALAPGYLDHPPMVALWIRAGTAIAGQGALGVRLLGPLAGALGSLLLFDAVERLWRPGFPRTGSAAAGNRATGVARTVAGPDHRTVPPAAGGTTLVAADNSATGMTEAVAGLVHRLAPPAAGGATPAAAVEASAPASSVPPCQPIPSQPGVAAVALLNATLMAGVGAIIMTPDTPLLFFWTGCLWALARLLHDKKPAWWLAIGLFAGLALASKYTALLLWLGIGLWLIWVPSQRHWWRSPMLWTGAALGALCFLPVVLWNARHGWVSLLRQGGRVDAWQPARAGQFLAELVGGQIGLATPLVFVLFAAGVGYAAQRAWRDRDPAWSLLAALTLPGAALFLQHALGDRVQGNWPAILYPAAAAAAAGLIRRRWQRIRWPAVGLGAAISLAVYVQASSMAVPVPPRIDPIAHQLAGWDALAAAVDAARRAEAVGFVTADEYGVAAELARALPAEAVLLEFEPRWHLLRLPAAPIGDAAGILVQRAGSAEPAGWRETRLIGETARISHGVAVQRLALWRVAGPLSAAPAVVLPRYAPALR